MCNATIVDFPVLRKAHTFQLVSDAQALLAAHDAERVRNSNIFLFNTAVSSGREQTLLVLRWEDSVLTDVTVVMVADARSINRLDRLQDLFRIKFLRSRLLILGVREHVSLFRHTRQSVTSHDISIV